jgi:thioredoxin 1
MHPIFTKMAKEYKQVRFARVNVDNAQDIAMKYGVQSIPTFIMFKNGEIANQMVGAVGESGIHTICKKFVKNQ